MYAWDQLILVDILTCREADDSLEERNMLQLW
jgi:hypothetical protein